MDGYVYKRTQHYDGIPINEDFSWKLWVPLELTKDIIVRLITLRRLLMGVFIKLFEESKNIFIGRTWIPRLGNLCESVKRVRRPSPPMGKESEVVRPFQSIYVDFLGPYPRSKAWHHLSKYVLLKAMRKANAKNEVKFLISEVFYKFGTPETIVSDNGQQFVSTEFRDTMKNFGIKHLRTATHSPQVNSSFERESSRLGQVSVLS